MYTDPKHCPNCEARLESGAKYCKKCGTKAPVSESNYCTNESCTRCTSEHEFDEGDLYCDECGKSTTLGEQIAPFL